jgi:hypothetical protein
VAARAAVSCRDSAAGPKSVPGPVGLGASLSNGDRRGRPRRAYRYRATASASGSHPPVDGNAVTVTVRVTVTMAGGRNFFKFSSM